MVVVKVVVVVEREDLLEARRSYSELRPPRPGDRG